MLFSEQIEEFQLHYRIYFQLPSSFNIHLSATLTTGNFRLALEKLIQVRDNNSS